MLGWGPRPELVGSGGLARLLLCAPLLGSEHSLAPLSAGPGAGELEGVAAGARGAPRQVSESPPVLPPQPGLCAGPPEDFDG